jgi:hypothetical protein
VIWLLLILCAAFVVVLVRPIKNEFGTFGDDDYDYEAEARVRGWIEGDSDG